MAERFIDASFTAEWQRVERALKQLCTDRPTRAIASRRLGALIRDLFELVLAHELTIRDARQLWEEWLLLVGNESPHDVPYADRMLPGSRARNGRKLPFPPTDPIEAAEATCIAMYVFALRNSHPEYLRGLADGAERPVSASREAPEDYRPLSEFPKAQREKIGKAAERGKTIKRKRSPNRRHWLYSVGDVVETYGEMARPAGARRGTTKGHEGTRRDK